MNSSTLPRLGVTAVDARPAGGQKAPSSRGRFSDANHTPAPITRSGRSRPQARGPGFGPAGPRALLSFVHSWRDYGALVRRSAVLRFGDDLGQLLDAMKAEVVRLTLPERSEARKGLIAGFWRWRRP